MCLVVSGCGDSAIVARSKALIAPVEAGVRAPTGTIDTTTAPAVLHQLYGHGEVNTPVSTTSGNACAKGEGTEDDPQRIDMSCASNGAVTGTVTMRTEADGDDVYTLVAYDDVCVVAEDFCLIDGEGAFVSRVEEGGFKSTLQGNEVHVRADGVESDRVFGMAILDRVGGWLLVVDGKSYVVALAASVDLDGESSVTLVGDNGEFTCSFTERGLHGHCMGPSSFDW